MKYYCSLFLLVLIPLSAISQSPDHSDCYTIVVGKHASIDGSVMVGHNEDDKGNPLVNWLKIPYKNFKPGDSVTLKSGKRIKQINKTAAYLRLQVTGEDFGDAYLNQHSVLICSNACQSNEDSAQGHIGYDLRRLLAERAHTAKEAVLLAGGLIQAFGYESSGRTYTIADKNEAWMLAVVKGKRWIAQRIPDSCVAIIPNYYTIRDVKLNDSSQFLASDDLIDYAILTGRYDSTKTFIFRSVYGDSATNLADWNIPRHISGINALQDKIYKTGDAIPFSFVPNKKLSPDDIKSILSSHYENDPDLTCTSENPHNCKTLPICRTNTQYSFVAQLRPDLPDILGALLWISPYNACIFPYIPIYSGVFTVHPAFGQENWSKVDSIHFDSHRNKLDSFPEHAYNILNAFTEFVESDYPVNIQQCQAFKEKIEKELDLNRQKLEKSVLQVYNSYPDDARKLLTRYCDGYAQNILNYYKTFIKQ